jgi:monofunctional chorismate mutase
MTTTMGCSAFAVRLTSEGRRVEPKLSTERAREGIMVNIADPAAKLRDLRDPIDDIDAAIIHMLAERFRYTRTVGILKAEHELPSRDPGREAEQISRCGILPRSANSTRVLPRSSWVLSLRGRAARWWCDGRRPASAPALGAHRRVARR